MPELQARDSRKDAGGNRLMGNSFLLGDPYTFIECVQTIDALEVATSVRDPSLARNGRWKSGVL